MKNLLSSRLDNSQHLYLVHADGKGNEKIIRGGSGSDIGILGGSIEIENNISISKSKDAYDGTIRHSKKLGISENKTDEVWGKLSETAETIDKARLEYDNLDGESFNSNSVIKTILEENKIKTELPGISKNVVPGWENNLSSKPSYKMRKKKRKKFE